MNGPFLNQIWNVSIYRSTNGPFWPTPYEFLYYILFAALYYLKRYRRLRALVAGVLIAGPTILTAFPIWLFRGAVARTTDNAASKGFGHWVDLLGQFAGSGAGLRGALRAGLAENPVRAQRPAARWPVDFWPFSYLEWLLVALNMHGAARLGERLLPLMEKCRAPIR